MERESTRTASKLTGIAARDFPGALEILVSFPDQWEFLDVVKHESMPLYVAGFPIERAHSPRDHFEGLSPEINVNLVFYRLYKFFQPWPLPQVAVAWDGRKGEGRVVEDRGFNLQLRPVGQAQAWFGLTHGVIWECYLERTHRVQDWEDTLAQIWGIVEQDVRAPHLLTAPHEPTMPTGYPEFLTRLGYTPNAEYPLWWSKQRAEENCEEIKNARVIVRASK